MALALGALLAPGSILRLRTPFVDFVQPFDRDIEIPYSAEMAVQPLQFFRKLRLLRAGHHGREEGDGCPQPREHEAHLMQGLGVTAACRLMECRQILEVAARDSPKCCVARHRGSEPRCRVAPQRLHSPGVSGALTCWFQ